MNAKENQKAEVPDASKPGSAPAAAGNKTEADNAESAKPPPTPRGTPEQIEQWKAKADKADEHWDRLLRTTADLENFKKRAARERQEAVRFANAALLEKLVPALDNFDMALAAANNAEGGSMESLKTGIAMIYNQLKAVLTEAGLEEIDASGQRFDPNLHEAVSQQESSEVPEGHVLQQLRKGYKLRDRLIRPAGVVVAHKPGR
jgi:molecular chaperone GrpE